MKVKLFVLFLLFSVTALTYGVLKVDSYPARALVYIDGEHLGYTPFSMYAVEGYHRVAINKKGFEPYEEYVYIGKDTTVQVKKMLRIRQDYSTTFGKLLVGIKLENYEPREWLFEKINQTIRNVLEEMNIAADIVSGEGLSPTAALGYSGYLEFILSHEETDGKHSFSLSLKHQNLIHNEKSFEIEKIFYVTGIRENFDKAYLPVLQSAFGELAESLVDELYDKVAGKIEFINVDIQKYPEISLIFRAYDEYNTPLSKDTMAAGKLSIIEADNFIQPLQLIPIKQEDVLNFTLALDRSGSMKSVIEKAKLAAKDFLSLLPTNSSIALIAFDNEIELLKNFTDNRQELSAALHTITAQGSTPLYDTVVEAVKLLSKREGPRFLVLVTDGVDANLRDTGPGSRNSISEAIKAARENNVVIFAIGLGRNIDKFSLGTLTTSTGGSFLESPTIEDLGGAFSKILSAFENLYIARYISTGERTGILRIDTPTSRIEGEFLIPIPEISLELSAPASVVAGMPFEISVSSLATMTAPINLTLKGVTKEGTLLWQEERSFYKSDSFESVFTEPGEFFIELSAFRFLERKKVEVVSIEELLKEYLDNYRYPEAANMLEKYLKVATLKTDEKVDLINLLAEIELRASLVDGSLGHLKTFLEMLEDMNIEDKDLPFKKALFEYLLDDKEAFSHTVSKLPSDKVTEELAAIKIIQALETAPKDALLLVNKLLKMYPTPLIRRLTSEVYIENSEDKKAVELGEEALNAGDLIDLTTAAYVALMTGNTELLEKTIETADKFEALLPLAGVWRNLQIWVREDIIKAEKGLKNLLNKYPDSNVVLKSLATVELASGKIGDSILLLKKIDPVDKRFTELLSRGYQKVSLVIERPVTKKIISWEGDSIFIRARRNARVPLPIFLNSRGMTTYTDTLTLNTRSIAVTTIKKGVNLLKLRLENLDKFLLDSDEIMVILDQSAPEIIVDDFFFTSEEEVKIRFKIKDDTGIAQIMVDDKEVTPTRIDKDTFSLNYRTDRRSKAIVISVSDLVGNITHKKIYILYDTKKPLIEIKGPTITGKDTVVASITVTDDTGIEAVLLDGKEIKVDGKKKFTYNYTIDLMGKESATLKLSAVDRAGNVAERTYVVKKDHVPPQLDLKLPTNIVSKRAEITVIATDSGGISFIKVQNLEKKYSGELNVEDTFEIELKESGDIFVEAGDISGNISRVSQYIFVDKAPPAISYLPQKTSDGMAVKVLFEDDSGLKYVKVGKHIDKLDGKRKYSFIVSQEELQEKLEVVAIDITGKRTQKALRWIPFEIEETSGSVMTSDILELRGRLLEPTGEKYSLNIYADAGEKLLKTSTQKGNEFKEWVPLSPGENELVVVIKTSEGIGIKDYSVLLIPRHEAMRVTLTWDSTAADLDLYIREPDGTVVGPMNPASRCAYIDVDARQRSSTTETYILNYKDSYLPDEGNYHIAVHYYSSEYYPNTVNYKIVIDTLDKHIERSGELGFFNRDNLNFLAGGNDWVDIGEIFVSIPDKEFPVLMTNLPETAFSAENIIEIEISATDNTGIRKITTDAVRPGIAEKTYETYGRREVYLTEKRFFPEGISYFNISAEDLFGLKKTMTYKIYVDTQPPHIEVTKNFDEEGNLSITITFTDNLGLSFVSIGGKKYQFRDSELRTRKFTITERIMKGSTVGLMATDIVGHVTSKTVGW
ncbi:PEGA domain-containing protein [Kosmotoga pacifica]|uniref:VWFA domain-containing protein n=1 Tax=Kosmotoga pacifica TaxID=1330330 RepID=A0A0G2ZAB5_9BACT|nr:PEGA domain-containing protein [Kosmotoga pacifica]AKI97026.1 hypothetical protein IX53_03405 [Kosmotoga pacifica]